MTTLRKDPRALLGKPIWVSQSKKAKIQGNLVDVSITGGKIQLNSHAQTKIKQNDIFEVSWVVVAGTLALNLKGEVQWHDIDQSTLGLRWVELPILTRKIIQRVVYFHRA
jgi:hypothetical protein